MRRRRSRMTDLAHPLISTSTEDRLRHARGQSFPDLVALRSGEDLLAPDVVASPQDVGEVSALIELANG